MGDTLNGFGIFFGVNEIIFEKNITSYVPFLTLIGYGVLSLN